MSRSAFAYSSAGAKLWITDEKRLPLARNNKLGENNFIIQSARHRPGRPQRSSCSWQDLVWGPLCKLFVFFMTAWTKQQFLRKAVCQPKTPGAFSWINCKPTKLNGKLLDKINYENRFSSVCFKQANGINGTETHTVWKHCKSSFAYYKPLHTAVIQPTDKIKTILLDSCYG